MKRTSVKPASNKESEKRNKRKEGRKTDTNTCKRKKYRQV
jgi:hypothetical protein